MAAEAPTDRIAAAQEAVRAATAAFERAIRDAANGGTSPSDIARALGTKNRQRVYAILKRDPDGGEATEPQHRPTVYLRGPGMGADTWERVETAMWARGWATEHDRTRAWHLARGGVPVVLCDFSATQGDLYSEIVTVARVRARWREEQVGGELGDLLSTADHVRAYQDRVQWLQWPVTRTVTDMELARAGGPGEIDRPYRSGLALDEDALARAVAEAFES